MTSYRKIGKLLCIAYMVVYVLLHITLALSPGASCGISFYLNVLRYETSWSYISEVAIDMYIVMIFQTIPFAFAICCLGYLKRNEHCGYLIFIGIFSMIRAFVFSELSRTDKPVICTILLFIFWVLNIGMIITVIAVRKENKDERSGSCFVRYNVCVLFFAVIVAAISAAFMTFRSKDKIYLSESGTHSQGSYSSYKISDANVVNVKQETLQAPLVFHQNFLMGLCITPIKAGNAELTFDICHGAMHDQRKYLIVVNDDLTATISGVS